MTHSTSPRVVVGVRSYIDNYRKTGKTHVINSYNQSVKNLGFVGKANEKKLSQIERESKMINSTYHARTLVRTTSTDWINFESKHI